MARYAYVNGRYVEHREASVHIEDRGYQLADGVYEVVGVRDGKLIDEALHIDRLGRSLGELPPRENRLMRTNRKWIAMLAGPLLLLARGA
jgi:branched-subunit amino acid aminotransferase/4-amino-4-deoxychorismate lyase